MTDQAKQQAAESKLAPEAQRRPYSTPELHAYGSAIELTRVNVTPTNMNDMSNSSFSKT
jgi:hypothetical protein